MIEPASYNKEKNTITINLNETTNPKIRFIKDTGNLTITYDQLKDSQELNKELIRYYEILLGNIIDFIDFETFNILKKLSQKQYKDEKKTSRRILPNIEDYGSEIILNK